MSRKGLAVIRWQQSGSSRLLRQTSFPYRRWELQIDWVAWPLTTGVSEC
jgi:hypothetical protein